MPALLSFQVRGADAGARCQLARVAQVVVEEHRSMPGPEQSETVDDVQRLARASVS